MNEPLTKESIRQMRGQEGLILMGCGGSAEEWESGINNWLTEEGILLDGTKFTHISPFRYNGMICLLFSFTEDVRLNVGKLAVWRIQNRESFGAVWLSDFLDNQLPWMEETPGVPAPADEPETASERTEESEPKQEDLRP